MDNIKLLDSMDAPCSELAELRTTAGRGEVDSVFITLMLGAHTSANVDGQCISDFNFCYEDAIHIIIIIWLLLLTFTLSHIQKMAYVFMCILYMDNYI